MPNRLSPFASSPHPGGPVSGTAHGSVSGTAARAGAPVRRRTALALSAAVLVAGAACTSAKSGGSNGGSGDGAASAVLTVGTTDKVVSLDPAGAWDAGSGTIAGEVYSPLLSAPNGTSDVAPDLASGVKLTAPTQYTVTLKPGLKFANGHELTSSDVKFSFDRQLKIADKNGPSPLLANLASVAAPDPTTVVFTLKSANDSLFPQVLSTGAGLVLDEEVFPADKVLDDDAIVKARPWSGPYGITSYGKNSLVAFEANTAYQGQLGKPKTPKVRLKYYTDPNNLKLDVQQGGIDVVYRTLATADLQDLATKKGVTVHTGSGNGIRYLVFDFKSQPYGSGTPQADPAKALAVRQAVAHAVDRKQLASQVYKNTLEPLYTSVPDGITGATPSYRKLYGDKNGGPSKDAAAAVLAAAGVTTPVTLKLQYNTDHYGSSSADEYALLKTQLEATGLFKVDLQSTEWSQYGKDRVAGLYPVYQLGWYADYLDADNYVGSFFAHESWVNNGYDDPAVQALIKQEATETDPAARAKQIERIQDATAAQIPLLPLLQGSTAIVTRSEVKGVPERLTSAYRLRWAELDKG
ncbi:MULTISPECIES: ABC transporter substrate-binding protein [Kitasatospora]|uniref:Putative peptide ABC transporter substrate-binding protein n=1 Tax=Kitasatospora setae (strain ATCC 33774 / DSM 43861 / JCM 3304 / KCC A-0304 / NBRC 14216 / KM-6054) TaxID=452652 RepID=E4NJR7_KITSK|nr:MULTISPECIES: ABC transporter substrate-binding protein [Kitasatospora]BAJ33215.1 putative peptide ABC transporter substrate-binding protein [Kitasatospora setae KM-6054]